MLNSEVPLGMPSDGPKRPILLTLLFFDPGDSLERRRFELRGERVGLPQVRLRLIVKCCPER